MTDTFERTPADDPAPDGDPSGGPAASGSEEPSEPVGASPADESGEPIGPFKTWGSLFATLLIYTALTVVVLYALTVLFDRSVT